MWINARECVPLADGQFYVQTVYGDVKPMSYTNEGGWNTHTEPDGAVYKENAINDGYIARWYMVDTPPSIPTEWKEEYLKGVNKW